jgi:type IV pilus assembly protein PilY1
MTASIPADLNALDLTGDGYADIAYVGDLRGRVWRIDFSQSANSVAGMASGGVFADLGDVGVAGARRFFASPDVSLVSRQGASWLTVAIGSGHRELPLSDGCTPLNIALKCGGDADACLETDDRFYALRDHAPLAPKDWSAPQAGPVTEGDLVDVTPAVGAGGKQAAVPGGSAGWMLRLDSDPGEKAISPSRTFDHTVFIPTFVPLEREPEGDAAACTQAIGYNNLYQVECARRAAGPAPRSVRARGGRRRARDPARAGGHRAGTGVPVPRPTGRTRGRAACGGRGATGSRAAPAGVSRRRRELRQPRGCRAASDLLAQAGV